MHLCHSCSHIPTSTASSFHENIGMFTAAFTLMDERQWEACTSTTNPVESINRESVPKDGRQKSLSEVLTHLYRIDKIYAAKKVAASHNVCTTYRYQSPSSQEKRRERKRNWRRSSEVTAADDDPQGTFIIRNLKPCE